MPAAPSSMPDFRPRVLNEEFYSGSGRGIADLGKTIGAGNALGNPLFSETMLKALDGVSAQQMRAEHLFQQSILDPDSVNVDDITNAQARADLALNVTRTILSRVVQAWKDIINTR
jgi:flagellar hook-basal body complex protein FliE